MARVQSNSFSKTFSKKSPLKEKEDKKKKEKMKGKDIANQIGQAMFDAPGGIDSPDPYL